MAFHPNNDMEVPVAEVPVAAVDRILVIAKNIADAVPELKGSYDNALNAFNILKDNMFIPILQRQCTMIQFIINAVTSQDYRRHLTLRIQNNQNMDDILRVCEHVRNIVIPRPPVRVNEPEWFNNINSPFDKNLMRFLFSQNPAINRIFDAVAIAQGGARKIGNGTGTGGPKLNAWHKILKLDGSYYLVYGAPQSGKTLFMLCISAAHMLLGKTTVVVICRNSIGDQSQFNVRCKAFVESINKFMKANDTPETALSYVYVGDHLKSDSSTNKLKAALSSTKPSLVVALANPTQMQRLSDINKMLVDDGVKTKYVASLDEVDALAYGSCEASFRKILNESVLDNAGKVYGITATGYDMIFTEEKLKKGQVIRLTPLDIYKGIDRVNKVAFRDDLPDLPEGTPKVFNDHDNLYHIMTDLSSKTVYGDLYNPTDIVELPQFLLIKKSPLKSVHVDLQESISKTHGLENWDSIVYNGDGIRMKHTHARYIKKIGGKEGVDVYDSNGIRIKRTKLFKDATIADGIDYFFTLNELLREKGERNVSHVAIIAGDLAARCISFAGRKTKLHVTSMYYYPSAVSTVADKEQGGLRISGNFHDEIIQTLYAPKKVLDDIVKARVLQEELYERSLEVQGEDVLLKAIKTIPFHKLKVPASKLGHQKAAKITKVVKKPDGGMRTKDLKNLLATTKVALGVAAGVEEEEDEWSDADTDTEDVIDGGSIRRIKPDSLGDTSKGYYDRMIEYLEEHSGVWMPKGTMINEIANNIDEKKTLVNTSWDWHSDKSKNFTKITDDTNAGLMFKYVNKIWQVKYNVE